MNEETLKKFKDEICRHFDVVAEDLKDNIKIIAEQVAANTEKLQEHDLRFDKIDEKLQEHDLRLNKIEEKLQEHDSRFNKIDEKLQGHDSRLTKIDETLEVIKLDIEFIKNELKQKVSRDEFAALERRVAILEAKIKH
jgi:chromosome segregation ATPase